ncbi:unnamed protein product [Lepeophtheirus salmonis]|uniref:Cilia- and flagella-associated protein 299 n=1 Tax=Lepeophtheirus salmonis TaxID=72036 RepID=A0A7R8CRQ1_LEPSM|nr:unnamed protein product [Lepeophtheirus salmonis]CAF2907622.1 unnamed protein product [Lepeophtheirus salmonis]
MSIKIEISGHIDLAERQLSENWVPYLTGEKSLLPKNNSLTYFHWNRGAGVFNSSDNFEVVARLPAAYVIHRCTGKKINITDTTEKNGWVNIPDDTSRIAIYDLYLESDSTPLE